MVTIRCTAKLAKRAGLPVEKDAPASTTALGDWYAHILYIGRAQFLLFVSEKSRLAVVTPARQAASLADHLRGNLNLLCECLFVPQAWLEAELREMEEVHYAPTRSRSLLGTINDFKNQIEYLLARDATTTCLELMLALSGCPILVTDSFPDQATRSLLQEKYGAE